MTRKTDGEKIDELVRLAAALEEQVDGLAQQLSQHDRDLRDLKPNFAVVSDRVEELRKSQERWGQRLWMLLAPFAGAVIGSLLTFFLAKK
jgi:uncharacterized membrane protein YoaK (UPF0700 family)